MLCHLHSCRRTPPAPVALGRSRRTVVSGAARRPARGRSAAEGGGDAIGRGPHPARRSADLVAAHGPREADHADACAPSPPVRVEGRRADHVDVVAAGPPPPSSVRMCSSCPWSASSSQQLAVATRRGASSISGRRPRPPWSRAGPRRRSPRRDRRGRSRTRGGRRRGGPGSRASHASTSASVPQATNSIPRGGASGRVSPTGMAGCIAPRGPHVLDEATVVVLEVRTTGMQLQRRSPAGPCGPRGVARLAVAGRGHPARPDERGPRWYRRSSGSRNSTPAS